MRAEASSSYARRAALMPESLPPIMRIDKGIRLWFRFNGRPGFEAGWKIKPLAGRFHCVAQAGVGGAGESLSQRNSAVERFRRCQNICLSLW